MLEGPYNFTFDDLETRVPKSRCGVFALGYVDASDRFRVQRVGRDDSDLQQRLKDLIGSSLRFKFRATTTSKMAFESECELFHRLRPPGNFMHPDRPPGSDWRCPICFRDSSQ
jgi:hypothetical protein